MIQKIQQRADLFQRRHRVLSFPYAVVKKYGDDNGGYQAALITYYGFLSLFPLLLVLVTVLALVLTGNPHLQQDIMAKVGDYFPLLGNQLEASIHGSGKSGLGLIIGTVITFYGARGAADALRFALDSIWHVPKNKRPGFPKAVIQSFAIMGIGALGFIVTVAAGSLTSILGSGWLANLGLGIIAAGIAALVFALIFRTATAKHVGLRDVWVGATIAAVAIQMLLTFGSLIVASQLKNLSSLYGTFAIVLGLLFWIYLIAQIVVYAAEIDAVRTMKLWPRALVASDPTAADKRVAALPAIPGDAHSEQPAKTDFSAKKTSV